MRHLLCHSPSRLVENILPTPIYGSACPATVTPLTFDGATLAPTHEVMDFAQQALSPQAGLGRFRPRVERVLNSALAVPEEFKARFLVRANAVWPRLESILDSLYGSRSDYQEVLADLISLLARCWVARPTELKELDVRREENPNWFLSQQMLGAVIYADLFGDTLRGVRSRIPYLKELGITYLHIMPPFHVPLEHNDGGYAVSSYRRIRSQLGTMEQLRQLAADLRHSGISLVLDFVFNHTSEEHDWALQAKSGNPVYQAYYYMFPNRRIPDQYERTLREIFPTARRGSFTWYPGIERWVWTTFHSFQWDINYSNPAVFLAMVEEMLFLANCGLEVLRLDAVAFIWKRLGTSCENLPEAHEIIRAFNAAASIAAPAVLFKSEAIVHPDDVKSYISTNECELSYNPLLMALLWEALATREIRLLSHSMRHRFELPHGCTWVNYVRSHDDIGWTFDDGDARALGIDPQGHRRFLNEFYTGEYPGSFARGLPFQKNETTGDCRVSGTLASLAGLESAMLSRRPELVDLAIRRILLLHAITLSIGGIPLIYAGDETGTRNNYSFEHDGARKHDSRWVHRVRTDWQRAELRHDASTIEGRIFQGLLRLIRLRESLPALRGTDMNVIDARNAHIFAYRRPGDESVAVLASFSELPQQTVSALADTLGRDSALDVISERRIDLTVPLSFEPYQVYWLK